MVFNNNSSKSIYNFLRKYCLIMKKDTKNKSYCKNISPKEDSYPSKKKINSLKIYGIFNLIPSKHKY